MYSKNFLALLNKSPSPHFLISTHKFCDGDGLGAGLALYHGLKKKRQKASFFTLEKHHPKYDFMNKKGIIHIFDKEKTHIPKDSILIFVDVNDTRLIEPLYSSAKKKNCKIHFIDHHPLIQENTEDQFFIDTTASSTAELIYNLLKKLEIPFDEDIANSLFSSIVFDTNLFRYIKNSPKPFSIAAELMPKIKDVNLIYENLFKNLTTDKLRFMSQLEKIEYYSNNQVAFLHLKEKDFKEYNTDATQAYDLMDMVRDVESIESTALIIENEDGSFKLSLRSRKKDLLPLVKNFNGGGHCHSAGAYFKDANLKDIKDKVISYLVNPEKICYTDPV